MLVLKSIEITHSPLQLGSKPLVELDTQIAAGEVLTLMGPSGCGKSTLLNYILGLLPSAFAAKGEIILNNLNISHLVPHKRELGILFQDALLFEHLSVGENILFGLKMKGTQSDKKTYVVNKLKEVGLADVYDRSPNTLSGGQKVRVALLRTLAARPKALLLDEPFSKLDSELREQMRIWLFSFVKNYQIPTLMVTHDLADANHAGGRIINLKR